MRLIVSLAAVVLAALFLPAATPQGVPAASPGAPFSITPQFQFHQKGAPVRLVGGASHITEGFKKTVYLVNVSDKTVVKCRLGWVVRGAEGAGTAFLGLPFDREIPAGDLRRVDLAGFSMSTVREVMDANKINHGVVSTGLVYAKFEDGTEWSYPLAIKRRFEIEEDPALFQRMRPALEELNRQIRKDMEERQKKAG